METVSEDYQEPICCACGVLVCPREDLPCFDFFRDGRKVQALWTSFYRAIVVRERSDPASLRKQSFYLSGVEQLDYSEDVRPLSDRTLTVSWTKVMEGDGAVGRSRTIRKRESRSRKREAYPVDFWIKRNGDRYPRGFPVHAHCWAMVQRIIGQSAEDELDLLLEVFDHQWKTRPRPLKSQEEPKYGLGFEESLELGEMWDPMDIPDVLSVIRRCSLRGSKRRSSCSQGPSTCTLDLPLDILLQILDSLHAVDAERFLAATQWQPPSSYWRSRFPKKLIFEVEELLSNSSENVDWQFLCVEVEKLLVNESLHGLHNRQRIFGILEETKESFFSRRMN